MRIVVAQDAIDTEGGVGTYLLSVIGELCRRGHQIALIHPNPHDGHSALRGSAHVVVCVSERGLGNAMARLSEWKPDVCYSHNMAPLDVERALLESWPVVKMLHGFLGTCVSGLKMHAFPSRCACHRTFGPACLALYFPRRCGQLSPGALVRGYRWASDQRALFDRYASIVVASGYMSNEVARHGAPRERVAVLPLFSTLSVQSSLSEPEKDTILFAGRMTTLKGGHVLVAAAARASRTLGRPIRLIMAGDGPQKEAWRRLASAMGVDAEFTGWVEMDCRAALYSRGLLVAVPSLWPEPFGLVGLDLASLGRPAVAFDVGGIRDWLTDGVNGRLVDPGAGETGLAAAMCDVLESPGERDRMARESLDVARRMTVGAHVDRLEPVLKAAARA
jgi:glycosyltransferase involved in cell wall biosynthesis